jgi:hypothetical protein
MELCDKSLDYTPFGFADIWKGNYHGEPVCIKAVRRDNPIVMGKIKRICASFVDQRRPERALYMPFRRGRKSISHPNVLPIIDVSETLFPFCIMSPWTPDGNIAQYAQVNPGADRPVLVRAHQPEVL